MTGIVGYSRDEVLEIRGTFSLKPFPQLLGAPGGLDHAGGPPEGLGYRCWKLDAQMRPWNITV